MATLLTPLALAVAQGAPTPESVNESLRKGAYPEALESARAGIEAEPDRPDWALLLTRALTATGKYREASEASVEAARRFPLNLQVGLAAYDGLRSVGRSVEAKRQLAELERLARSREWAYRAPADRVALGKIALLIGGDPKRVLELFFDPVRKEQPDFRESYVASGELALQKNDFALAAKTFAAAAKKFPEDPEIWFGLARAYAPTNAEAMAEALEKTLKLNAQHVGAQLLLADHHIDAENYTAADEALASALKTNPHHPETHAYRALLGHLRGSAKVAKEARVAALAVWARNPEVPHLIGKKLAQKYRFAEGAALQREALQFDADFLPAKAQLANDLLRLGEDAEGWKLAEEVQKADPYDVVAFNLTTLRDAISHFRVLESPRFTVRMDPREAAVYGQDVLALLERAHSVLTKKYGMELAGRTIVEIFPDQKDFAIRTFGLPGGGGYLGVCFGRVITANSPASRPGSPSNWEAVLWHEFAHVVTLTMTKNKMPRWLSEGISVFEERQVRSSWGEQMKPRYRAMILSDDLTPVSQLSAAFLKPKTAMHLGFAYYESSLVVEWLVEKWGLEKMKRLLADLARGIEINTALASHFAPIDQLDAEFAERARELAKNTGPRLDWTKPAPAQLATQEAADEFIEKNPNNYTALLELSKKLISEEKWPEAKKPLTKLIELYPNQHEPESAYSLLARVHRELGEADAELAVLSKLADLSADATEAYKRIMEVAAERKEWPKVLEFAERFQAVDPLRPEPHRYEAEAHEQTGKSTAAVSAYRALLELNPPDPSEVHFRLARLLHAAGDSAARKHLLLSLEEAPRFRAAHALLLEIAEPSPATNNRGERR